MDFFKDSQTENMPSEDLHFDPLESGYKSKSDKRAQAKPATEIAKRQAKLAAEYAAHLEERIGRASIGSRTIVWTPTLFDRNKKFRKQGPKIIIASLAGATETELALLEAYTGHAAAKKLREHGVLPDGMVDHWKIPLRAGGEAAPDNVCIMIADMRKLMEEKRTVPAFNMAYANMKTGEKLTLGQLEAQASDYMRFGTRELPSELKKSVRIPYPNGVIELTQADLDMRDVMAAENQAIAARIRVLSHERPGHRSCKQSGGPRR